MQKSIPELRLCCSSVDDCVFRMYDWDVVLARSVACCEMSEVVRGNKTSVEACIEKKIEAEDKTGE